MSGLIRYIAACNKYIEDNLIEDEIFNTYYGEKPKLFIIDLNTSDNGIFVNFSILNKSIITKFQNNEKLLWQYLMEILFSQIPSPMLFIDLFDKKDNLFFLFKKNKCI